MTTNNHPAHGPVSLDRLHQISKILSKAAAQSDGGNLGYAMADAVKVIDGAIAVFGAEPAPLQLPVQHWEELCRQNPDMSIGDAIIRASWWNHCAAVLQGTEPVNNSDELPLGYLQGHKDGLEWAAQLAEANHPQTGDWLYDDPIELARAIRKGPDMLPVQTASVVDADDNFYSWFGREWEKYYQPNNYSLSAKKHLGAIAESAWFACRAAILQAGNSPVAPDTWIPVSERMPEVGDIVLTAIDGCVNVGEAERSGANYRYFTSVISGRELPATHWQPLPEPPKEVG
ncbi:DUF551 domain-containing protein [Citrobacter portucalensis]|uniref:DUF551 domain-containing protein n=1 Tax=Citrobacter portucalensis TaxID=1639133 RepID=UPI001C63C99D|nr:DUF551 domain-containing protein [Citrobacter portucalensis]MBW7622481.1 DUF551 domain-containing protein [Citrobacter portucalensis]MBW7641435.1 DUF551 domain-containing protein [Citrobacter portucalensis]MCA2135953.1 DUF551 domain-containing protein [Citrobacter portucalensis]MCA2146131.1 DUF551 domain-containing protein [Citrobacter portucalensis]MCA2150935.1 DUF551 domain-containing protein [Citrobacter portucalensis]